jgi:hypothetical protein
MLRAGGQGSSYPSDVGNRKTRKSTLSSPSPLARDTRLTVFTFACYIQHQRLRARLFETADMRAGVLSLCLAIAVAALAQVARANPFDPALHHWGLTLAVALVGLFLLACATRSLRPSRPDEGFAALGALGATVIAIAFVSAELTVGPPQAIAAAPGQTYHPPHFSSVAIEYPQTDARSLAMHPPSGVLVVTDGRAAALSVGSQLRTRSFVFDARSWPAAYVLASSSVRIAQTVTQPNGAAFVSPVLLFPDVDSDGLPVDSFSVPALHRDVHVKYYPGLPARGIDIPFVQLQVNEENGSTLFTGVSVSGRQLHVGGMDLTFMLGTYPVVTVAPIPDAFMTLAGACMVGIGLLGYLIAIVRAALAPARP